MRTHLEFASTAFPAALGEDQEINPGRFGKALAEFLRDALPLHGFKVRRIVAEDWGWMVDLDHNLFPLWIGCGNYEEFEHGFLCFIEPSKRTVWKGFSKIDPGPTVERLGIALESILRKSGKVSKLRWWTEDDVSKKV